MSKLYKVIRFIPKPIRRFIPEHIMQLYKNSKHPSILIPELVKQFCQGKGLEIGPGKLPYGDPRFTEYLDKHTDNKDGMPNPDIVADAYSIPRPDASFDFVISSHCLEHCQNTLKMLNEWLRVLKPGGILFLILPHGDRTLDRHREKTTLQHHIDDLNNLTDEPDRSHIDEIMAGWSKNENFEARKLRYKRLWGADIWDWDFRFRNDVIHFHVWTQDEMVTILQYLGLQLVYVAETVPERSDSFLTVARKPC